MSTHGDEFAIYDNGTDVSAVWRIRFGDDSVDVPGMVSADVWRGMTQLAVMESDRTVDWSATLEAGDIYIMASEAADELLAWEARPLDGPVTAVAAKRQGGGLRIAVDHCTFP